MKQLFGVVAPALIVALSVGPIFGQRGGGGGHAGGGGFGGRGGFAGGGGGFAGGSHRGGGGPIVSRPSTIGPIGPVNSGFGSVVFPGGVSSFGSIVNPVYSNLQNSFAGRLGNVVAGGSPYQNNFIGGGSRRTAVYPVPVFVGGGYGYGGYGGGYGYDQSPNVTIINTQPAVPPIIINQDYQPDPPARPVMRVYGSSVDQDVNVIQVPSPSNPEGNPISRATLTNGLTDSGNTLNPTDEPTVYLIALRDGTIYASYAYWTERDMLHYITPGHVQNQVSLDRVDLALSRRLNRERKLEFNPGK